MSIKVGILGVGGYTGLELVKLIKNHPEFELSYAATTSKNSLSNIFTQLNGVIDLDVNVVNVSELKERAELVFMAMPHTQSMNYIKELPQDFKIVDLSADYRISLENYEAHYAHHIDILGLKRATYGLVEINRQAIANSTLIANPGCYPTCSLLAALPFAKFLNPKDGLIIDAKSGLSGAGKALKESSHFVSANENCTPYSPFTHRHSIEIKEHFEKSTNASFDVLFVPHLLPLNRGMIASIYASIKDEFCDIEPLEILKQFYKDDKFIRILYTPPCIKNVAGTHFCDIYAKKMGNKLWVCSSIDNLLRGASSQAMANANILCGFDENLALPELGCGI